MNKRLYISLLEEADKTVVLSESYHKGCFHRRNDFLVKHAAIMLAYWDGQPYGGTYYTVKKAIEAGKKIVNLYKWNHYETVQQDYITVFEKLFRELCKEARKDFIDFLLSEVEPIYWREILKIMV